MPMSMRPQVPMQRGFGQRQMHPRFQGGISYPGFSQSQNMGRTSTPNMGRNIGNKGGGLLSKILGGGKQQGSGFRGEVPSMSRSIEGGGLLKSLTNPESLNGLLNNTQSVLQTAQKLGPVFQQYGPLVRNLPSLWKLYRGFKDATSTNEDASPPISEETLELESTEVVEDNPSAQVANPKNNKGDSRDRLDKSSLKEQRSIPKLYI